MFMLLLLGRLFVRPSVQNVSLISMKFSIYLEVDE